MNPNLLINNIRKTIQDESAQFMHVKLTPGKYNYNGMYSGTSKLCYKEFAPSVAQIINQFTDITQYLQLVNKKAIRQMYLVMDEFSGYSMFTAVALKGFGLDKITTVLCYYQGSYTESSFY